MNLCNITKIAERVKKQLEPYCRRIEIAGSIRRQKPNPNDIEIVCIPATEIVGGLFCPKVKRVPWWSSEDDKDFLGEPLKGYLSSGKYIQFMLPEGVKLDLFTAHHDNWGLIYAIRTGSADFSHRALATGWVKAGYISAKGMLTKTVYGYTETIPIREEKDLFKLIGIPFVEPRDRQI